MGIFISFPFLVIQFSAPTWNHDPRHCRIQLHEHARIIQLVKGNHSFTLIYLMNAMIYCIPWYIPIKLYVPKWFWLVGGPTCGKTTHMVRAGENNHFASQLCLIHPIYIPLIALISHSTGLKSQVAAAGAAAVAMKRFRSPVLSPKAKARHLLDFIKVPSASFSFSSRDQTESATHYNSQTTLSQSSPISDSVTRPSKWHMVSLGLVQGCLKMYWCLFRVGLRFLQGFLMVCFRVSLGLS